MPFASSPGSWHHREEPGFILFTSPPPPRPAPRYLRSGTKIHTPRPPPRSSLPLSGPNSPSFCPFLAQILKSVHHFYGPVILPPGRNSRCLIGPGQSLRQSCCLLTAAAGHGAVAGTAQLWPPGICQRPLRNGQRGLKALRV